MGVDFDSCEDCGDYTCDQNIFYLDLEGYGRHKTCSVCVKEHFEELDPRENTDICIEVLEDEVDEAFQTTFYAVRVEDVPDKTFGDLVNKDKILKTTKSASEAKEWCEEDESIRVGFTQPWDVVKEDEIYVYAKEDGDLPILEAAASYEPHFEKRYDYSPFNSFLEEERRPKPHWKKNRMEQIDAKIEHLREKRRRIEEL